jgi:hypothetical protein
LCNSDKEGQQDFLFEFSWDSRMLENFFSIALNSDDLNIAWKEFENYKKNSSKINGELGEKCISNLFNAFLDKNDINKAIVCIRFFSELCHFFHNLFIFRIFWILRQVIECLRF